MSDRPQVIRVPLISLAPASEYSEPFLQGMLNRIAVSHHKYGFIADNFPHRVRAMDSAANCIETYAETRNTEYLIDAANYLMFEFIHPALDGAFFAATDSSGTAGVVLRDGSTVVVDADTEWETGP